RLQLEPTRGEALWLRTYPGGATKLESWMAGSDFHETREAFRARGYGRIGAFEIEASRFGMPETYRAHANGEPCELQLFRWSLIDPEEELRLQKEAEETRPMQSEQVLVPASVGRDKRGLYLVRPLRLGASLHQIMRARAPTMPQALALLLQAARGMTELHRAPRPLMGRCVRPDELHVDLAGRVYWRLPTWYWLLEGETSKSFPSDFAWASPEHCLAEAVDARANVFSLGVMAFEWLSGRSLFRADTAFRTMENVRQMPIPSLTSWRPDVPAAIADVVHGALVRDRMARPRDEAEFAQLLSESIMRAGLRVAEQSELVPLTIESGGEGLAHERAFVERLNRR
ncbi:MAG: hypothetical protein AAF645_16880, partial [Myxococcota bacterium]